MSKIYIFAAFCWGLCIGVWLMIAITFLPGNVVKESKTMVENCQKDLPRSQKCVLTAVPEKDYKGGK